MSEQSRFPRSLFGGVFAGGFVAGLVEDSSGARHVLEALAQMGLGPQDVRILPGECALEIDASRHPSLAVGPPAPGEAAASQGFLAGALLGDLLIAVRAPSDEEARAVTATILRVGATYVRYYEPTSVRTVEELSGVSA